MENSQTFTRKSVSWGVSLKCAYTNECSMGNKHEEVEICMQLKGCDVGITEARWDCSLDCRTAMEGYRLGRQDGGVALYVREQLEYVELCLGDG